MLELNEGVIPSVISMRKPNKYFEDELEEERRLMYVALTRAKENLYIIYTSKPSSFVKEIEELSKNAPAPENKTYNVEHNKL